MIKALALFAILCGSLLIFGGLLDTGKLDRMTLRVVSEKRFVRVSVYLPDITEKYLWLAVYGCSADVGEFGAACNGNFERESLMELAGRKQTLVFWRDLPGGTMRIVAIAFDVNRKVLARGTMTIFRS